MKNLIRTISIISYLSIILAGQMIGIPFVFWLIFTAFDFGNINQLFAIFGIIGIVLNLTKRRTIIMTIISFILMLLPIINILVQLPIYIFDYLAFQIPLAIFIITYLTYIIINAREKQDIKQVLR
jgi:hypothetical protein